MSQAIHPIPAWRVTLAGQDLTERIRPRLMSLRLTEARGEEADQLDLEIHDHDGRMAIPRRGVEVRVAIGWVDSGLFDKGSFTVDEVEHRGSPDVLSVRGRSADLRGPMRGRRERSWHDTTLAQVLASVAGENGLQARVDAALAATAIPHLDQAGESDAALLTRLGRRFDAVATVKAGVLLFLPIGAGRSATGLALPGANITRASGDNHAWAAVDRDKYSGVEACWQDLAAARRKVVLVGAKGSVKRLKRTFASEAQAREHAQAEWGRLRRGAATLRMNMALGRPDLSPEQEVHVSGFKPEIDGQGWLISRVSHSIDGSGGFSTSLEMETAVG